MNRTGLGIFSIVGVAAGSVAYLLYASMPEEKKRNLEENLLNSASKLIDSIKDSVFPSDNKAVDIDHSVVDSILGKKK